uniref:Uncharacterized protein n=1 Tax=Heterorhabditis bacteriophora TaxID=37862 RepID=A0A1I7XGZ8_HETBA
MEHHWANNNARDTAIACHHRRKGKAHTAKKPTKKHPEDIYIHMYIYNGAAWACGRELSMSNRYAPAMDRHYSSSDI